MFKMLCPRCLLPLLALYLVLEQISAAVIAKRPKRELNWPDHDVFSHLSDPSDTGDLSVGDAGAMRRVWDDFSETTIAPTVPVPVESPNKNQNRRTSDKRRKVAPLDSIGRFQIPSSQNRKEKKQIYGEE